MKTKLSFIFIVLGSFLASSNILGFREHSVGVLSHELDPICQGYYYPVETRLFFAIGVSLVILGILLLKENKKRS